MTLGARGEFLLPSSEGVRPGAVAPAVHPPPGMGDSYLAKARPLVMARTFTAGLTFAIPLVLTRKLSLPDYGTYKQLFLVAQTIFYVVPLGMPQALFFFIPRAERRRPFFGQTVAFLAVAGLLSGLALVAGTGLLARFFSNPSLLEYRWELGGYLGFLVGASTLEASLTCQGQTRQAAVAFLVFDGLRAAALVVPALVGYGLHGVMQAAVVFAALRLVAAWWLVLRTHDGPFFERGRFKEQFLYAAPFGASVLVAIPQQYAHQYAVSAVVGPALFAIYAVGCFQLPVIDLLYTPTSEVLMVRIGQLEKEGRLHDAVASFRDAVSKLALAFLPLYAFLVAAAPDFISLLFGAKFMAAVPLFRVAATAILLAAFPVDGVLRACNETRYIFRVTIVKALLALPLVYFGVTRLGMMGGILSYAIVESAGKAMLLARLPRALSTPERRVALREVFPFRSLAKLGGAALLAAAAVLLLRTFSGGAWPMLLRGFALRVAPLAAGGALFGIAYVSVLVATGIRPWAGLLPVRERRVGAGGAAGE